MTVVHWQDIGWHIQDGNAAVTDEPGARRRQTGARCHEPDLAYEVAEDYMKGFVNDIGRLTAGNVDFRRVLYTARNMQLVLMALQPGEEIGEEVHKDRDQFFRVEQGEGEIWIDGFSTVIKPESAMIVPAGARHNVKNTGRGLLQLYTIYAPPEHADGTVRATKASAEASVEHFDGRTTE